MRAPPFVLLVATVAACWTGPVEPVRETAVASKPPPQVRRYLRVRLEHTPCMGACPVYTVEIAGNGRITWNGRANVAAPGERTARASERELAALDRVIDRVQFFERNEDGRLPIKPQCTTDGTTTTCSMGATFAICSDTSHTIITVARGRQRHTVEDDNCSENEGIARLERAIQSIGPIADWIGR